MADDLGWEPGGVNPVGHENAITEQNQAVGAVPFYLLRLGRPSTKATSFPRLTDYWRSHPVLLVSSIRYYHNLRTRLFGPLGPSRCYKSFVYAATSVG